MMTASWLRRSMLVVAIVLLVGVEASFASGGDSTARRWNEVLLNAIRRDFATPTIHARTLYHVSAAMHDAWAAYDAEVPGVIASEPFVAAGDVAAARSEAISFAAYRLIAARFSQSPGAAATLAEAAALMAELGYAASDFTLLGPSPAAVGNRCGLAVIVHGLSDGSNQQGGYQAPAYVPVNPPLVVGLPGVGDLIDPNRWQPLSLDLFIDQFGNPLPWNVQPFLTPHWGSVTPFALTDDDRRPGTPGVYLDPGPPAHFGGVDHEQWRASFVDVVLRGSLADPDLEAWIDASPGAIGNNTLGSDDGGGHPVNPVTGEPYPPNLVRIGDFARVMAEYWADGPGSEAPPGHWNVIANQVVDHPDFQPRIEGRGEPLDALEWDVRMYLALNGALHDAAIAAWGAKGHYDFVRPITAIRFMAELGQSSDPSLPSYHPDGLPLIDGVIELITTESAAPGQRHAGLAAFIGEVAILTWPGSPEDPEIQYSGVRWIRGRNWIPYQLPTFVTPPFAGYVSGHSTFSRAAAEVLARMTGTPFFPGGMSRQLIPPGWLKFEFGPSETVELQWATYFDASDQSGASRIHGGIHPWIDDFPGRVMGAAVGERAWARSLALFEPAASLPGDLDGDGTVSFGDLLMVLQGWGACDDCGTCAADATGDCVVDFADLLVVLQGWS